MTDLEFLKAFKDIERKRIDGLRVIYDYYGHAVYSYAFSIVKNKEIAEDICHDVFLKLWKRKRLFKESINPKAYIMTIARNTAIDYIRKNKEIHLIEDCPLAIDTDISENIENKLLIEKALSFVKESEKEVILLHIISDLTFKNIGEILQKPIGTVTWRYNEGIKKIRKNLKL